MQVMPFTGYVEYRKCCVIANNGKRRVTETASNSQGLDKPSNRTLSNGHGRAGIGLYSISVEVFGIFVGLTQELRLCLSFVVMHVSAIHVHINYLQLLRNVPYEKLTCILYCLFF